MIEEDQTQRGRETKENQSNLYIIKCQEQKSEWVSSNEQMNKNMINEFPLIDIKMLLQMLLKLLFQLHHF